MDIYLRLLIANGKKKVIETGHFNLGYESGQTFNSKYEDGILQTLVQIMSRDSLNSILSKSLVDSVLMCM